MATYTIERQYLVPVFQHVTVEADTPENAMRLALDHDDWMSSEICYDDSRGEYVAGCWEGEDSYNGESLPIPAEFGDVSQELAGHLTEDDVELIVSALMAHSRNGPMGDMLGHKERCEKLAALFSREA
jgi:hypothetical protein